VVDASSSQSRADVLVILLSAVLLLTGLQWLALRPKVKPSVSISCTLWQVHQASCEAAVCIRGQHLVGGTAW